MESEEGTAGSNGTSSGSITSRNERQSNIFIYFGRESCPYCRKFVTTLNDIVTKEDITIYYFDTENTEQSSEKKQVRTKYGIDLVPSLICLKEDGSINKYYFEKDDLKVWLSIHKGE